MAVTTITEAIQVAASDIATISYGGVRSLSVQMQLWIDSIFSEATGVFPPSANTAKDPGQRLVTDWLYTNKAAKLAIEGAAPGASGLVGTAACINAVERTLLAVRDARLADQITAAKQTAVIAAYNAAWEP